MTKTTVRKHTRKGTKGVKRHSRSKPIKKEVPNRLKEAETRFYSLNHVKICPYCGKSKKNVRIHCAKDSRCRRAMFKDMDTIMPREE